MGDKGKEPGHSVLKRLLRGHFESYGKLGSLSTWLISVAVFSFFIILSFLIF